MKNKINPWVILSGAAVGVIAIVLVMLGNPDNMGFCIACFERDIVGSLGLHSAAKVQYMRPEIIGIVLGAMVMALVKKEFKAKAGSSPMLRFLIGAVVMIGALTFLGCPLRMVIRLGGGDVTAVPGLFGFIGGILIGIVALKNGFSLSRTYKTKTSDGVALPALMIFFLGLLLLVPSILKFSQEGPGSKHAFWAISLVGGLIVGALAQRSRLCMVGGIRDAFMFKDFNLLTGFGAIFVVVFVGNLILNKFNVTAQVQPVAHHDYIFSFLGMIIVGWGSVLIGGCPLRQLVLSGEGNSDSGVTVLGMMAGAAIAHNFGLAGNADSMVDGVFTAGGVSTNGRIAIAIGLVFLLIVTVANVQKGRKVKNG